jgi:hypothetical protein
MMHLASCLLGELPPPGRKVKFWLHVILELPQGRRISHMSWSNFLDEKSVVELEGLRLIKLLGGCLCGALPLL